MKTRFSAFFLSLILALLLASPLANADDDAGYYRCFDSSYDLPGGMVDWIGIVNPSEPNFTVAGSQDTYLMSDDGYSKVSLPFKVHFYEEEFQYVYILANGAITFYPPTSSSLSDQSFPTDSLPYAIAPFWSDLHPRDQDSLGNGQIRYAEIGTSPNRIFVVEWYDVAHYTTPSDRFNFQVQLYENSADIGMFYHDMTGTNASGAMASIGLNESNLGRYHQYGFNGSPNTIPVGDSNIFRIYYIWESIDWKAFDNTPVVNQNAIEEYMPWVTISETVSDAFFHGTLYQTNGSIEIRYFDGTQYSTLTDIGTYLSNSRYHQENYFVTYKELQLVNMGLGHCIAFVLAKLENYGQATGEGTFEEGQVLFSVYWNGSQWMQLTSSSTEEGIFPAESYYIHSFSAAGNPASGYMPGVVLSCGDPFDPSEFDIFYSTYFNSWSSLEMINQTLSGKIDRGISYDSRIRPCLKYTRTGQPWVSFIEVNSETMFAKLFYKSTDWISATWEGNDFQLEASNLAYPSLYIKAGAAVVAWYSDLDTQPTAQVYYCSNTSTSELTSLTFSGIYEQSEVVLDYVRLQACIDFRGRPTFVCNGMTNGGNDSLTVWTYDIENSTPVWNPLAMRREFGGLTPGANPGAMHYDISVDTVGNPTIIYALFNDTNTPDIYLTHYVITVDIDVSNGTNSLSEVHEYGTSTSTTSMSLWSNDYVSGTFASQLGGGVFSEPLFASFKQNEAYDITIDSSNHAPGVYYDTIYFSMEGVFAPPSVKVRLIKLGSGVTRTVPGDHSTLQDAFDSCTPGDKIFLKNGNYSLAEVDPALGIYVVGESIDGVVIRGSADFTDGANSFENLTLDLSTDSNGMNIMGADYLAFCRFVNVLVLFGSSQFYAYQAQVDFISCSLIGTVYAEGKIDSSAASPATILAFKSGIEMEDCIVRLEAVKSFRGMNEFEYVCYGSTDLIGIIDDENPVAVQDYGFVDDSRGDYHLKSQAGHYHFDSDSFVLDSTTSELIDASYPLNPVGEEMYPHNYRANLGAYGGTKWASKSYVVELETYALTVAGGNTVNDYEMRCVPLHPSGSEYNVLDGARAFKYDTTKMRVFAFDPEANEYIELGNGSDIAFYPGRGFWIIAAEETTVNCSGILPQDTLSFMELKEGWNMVGLPFLQILELNHLYVEVETEEGYDGFTRITNQPSGSEAVATTLYVFDSSTGTYVEPTDSYIPMGASFWIYAYKNTRLGYEGGGYKTLPQEDYSTKNYKAAPGLPPAPPSLKTTEADSSSSGSGGCFIATAAFGSLSAHAVENLTSFRDSSALSSCSTSSLVSIYYNVSPEVADAIRESESLRAVIRRLLD